MATAETVDLRPIRTKALAYNRDQRTVVYRAVADNPRAIPHTVAARVRGHNATYGTTGRTLPDGRREWLCDCYADIQATVADQCAHVAATCLVVGWPSAAAPLTTQTPPEEQS